MLITVVCHYELPLTAIQDVYSFWKWHWQGVLGWSIFISILSCSAISNAAIHPTVHQDGFALELAVFLPTSPSSLTSPFGIVPPLLWNSDPSGGCAQRWCFWDARRKKRTNWFLLFFTFASLSRSSWSRAAASRTQERRRCKKNQLAACPLSSKDCRFFPSKASSRYDYS